ncbi:MAG TPA: FAD-dependent oxidoreductase [Thermaerobacter sp.]
MGYDVIVVGGGIAGLTTGALLAAGGTRVLVLEVRPVLGGRGLVVRQGGFTLNYGYHFILGAWGSPHARVLKRLGLPVRARATWASGFARARRGRLQRFPAELLSTFRFFGFHDGLGYLGKGLGWLRKPAGPYMTTTLADFLAEERVSPRVAEWLLDIIRAIGFTAHPERFSAGHFLEFARFNVRHQLRPSLVLPWDALFEALRAAIVDRGGAVRLRAPVDRVEISGGRAAGVWTTGRLLEARVVILALPPQRAACLLPPGVLEGPGGRPATELRPTAGISLDLGVEGEWDLPWIAVDLADEGVVLARHSFVNPDLAPPGHTLFQAMRFVDADELADGERIEMHKQALLRAVETVYPGATQRVVLKRWLVRRMLTAAEHAADQPWLALPPVQAPGVPNLLFCGDGYRAPGELSNAAVHSAEEAAGIAAALLRAGPQRKAG